MIGNDVVDLALAATDSNWRRPGFLDKVFTTKEQYYILNHPLPDMAVWSLWSKKESAYKVFNRQSGESALNPLKFECLDMKAQVVQVKAFGRIYFTLTEVLGELLHTVAVTDLHLLGKTIQSDSAKIIKYNGMPYFECASRGLVPCSVSHHGRYYKMVFLS
jgi:phosphopantetheinyl transferase (holo-ACP synthase)